MGSRVGMSRGVPGTLINKRLGGNKGAGCFLSPSVGWTANDAGVARVGRVA